MIVKYEKNFRFSSKRSFMLNVDWFQPYVRRAELSIGVFHLVLLNLSREVSCKRENVIIAGIMLPLGKEPRHLNYYIKPLIKELIALLAGYRINFINT